MDIEQLLNKIRSVPKDNTLYLLEKFPCETGLFASNGNVLYMVRNDEHCASMNVKTDFLNLDTNIFVSAFNQSVSSFENGYYNSVELELSESSDIEANLSAFVNLCLAHSTYMRGKDFMSFFDSLVSLFQLPREQHYKNLIGLMGELVLIEYIYNHFGQDLSQYWHTDGSSSRLDFVCPFANFEVKTTASDSLGFTIKHDQLFTDSEKNHLVAVELEESNAGRTLAELINSLLAAPDYCNSMKFAVNIEQEKRRISSTELNYKRFLLKKIYAYRANDINPFTEIPDCVEGLSYKLDLIPFANVPFEEILPSRQSNEFIPSFQSLLQCNPGEIPNVMERLHALLDGKSGMQVAKILAAAKYKYHYLIDYPTERQYTSEFELNGTWRAVTSYISAHTTSTGEFTENIDHIVI